MTNPVLKKQKALTLALFAVYLLGLTWLVLFKLQFSVTTLEGGRIINLIPFQGSFSSGGTIRFSEIRNNILAFLPLGVYICMLTPNHSFMKRFIPIVALTAAFEIIQFIFAIGRSDITDIISNTLGGIIGIGVYALFTGLFKRKANTVINITALLITVLVLSASAFLLINHRWIVIR